MSGTLPDRSPGRPVGPRRPRRPRSPGAESDALARRLRRLPCQGKPAGASGSGCGAPSRAMGPSSRRNVRAEAPRLRRLHVPARLGRRLPREASPLRRRRPHPGTRSGSWDGWWYQQSRPGTGTTRPWSYRSRRDRHDHPRGQLGGVLPPLPDADAAGPGDHRARPVRRRDDRLRRLLVRRGARHPRGHVPAGRSPGRSGRRRPVGGVAWFRRRVGGVLRVAVHGPGRMGLPRRPRPAAGSPPGCSRSSPGSPGRPPSPWSRPSPSPGCSPCPAGGDPAPVLTRPGLGTSRPRSGAAPPCTRRPAAGTAGGRGCLPSPRSRRRSG
ncbi:hypothetical protein SHIRM173S_13398 [Streptomyces hirsutus]